MAKKIELLSPAGDLQRGKTALDFGADAIYTGAQNYSLRARASNFTYDNIEEICNYAHQLNKKVYVVSNVLCQNSMLGGYGEYLQKILSSKPDALIVSDPYIISQIRKVNKDIEIHISTQQSVSNSKAALFFARNKCNRIILSREVTFEELKQMIKNVEGKIDLEVFVHGAVCIAYSGRCMVSANFCLRDANIGGCAQSCRWVTSLCDENGKVYADNFSISAKDMCMITKLPELIKSGVKSLKIEGRMKSEYYIATVVNAYRKAIDAIYNNETYDEYVEDVMKAANREVDLAWNPGRPDENKMLYHEDQKVVKQNFAFTITKKINDSTYEILTRNNIKKTDVFEVISPKLAKIEKVKIIKMIDKNKNDLEICPTPMSVLTIEIDKSLPIDINDIGRIA